MDIKNKSCMGCRLAHAGLLTVSLMVLLMAIVVMYHAHEEDKFETEPQSQIIRGDEGHWTVHASPEELAPGTILGQGKLGSHAVTVSVPVLDAEFQNLLTRDNMSCVEVHYGRLRDGAKPAFAGEPDASAVYFFVRTKELYDGYGAIVSWYDEDGAEILCHGTSLENPKWVMKVTVLSGEDAPQKAEAVFLEDCFGGYESVFDTKTVFSENSLASFTFSGGSEL